MLRLIEIPLTFPEPIRVHSSMGSVFHGVLMELVDSNSAALYHHMTLRPYSQSVYWDGEQQRAVWRIGILTDDAYTRLIEPLQGIDKIWLSQKQCQVRLHPMEIKNEITFEELSRQAIQADSAPLGAEWKFINVVSFKQNGRYVILPDMRLIYQSLLQRWNTFSDSVKVEDEDLIEQLTSHCRLTKYQLQSSVFSVNGSTIYGCHGWQRIGFFGYDMLKRLQGMLTAFAPFAGVGVKTALGMGAVNTEILKETV